MGEPLVIVVPQSFRDDLERVREARMDKPLRVIYPIDKEAEDRYRALGYKAIEIEPTTGTQKSVVFVDESPENSNCTFGDFAAIIHNRSTHMSQKELEEDLDKMHENWDKLVHEITELNPEIEAVIDGRRDLKHLDEVHHQFKLNVMAIITGRPIPSNS